MASKLRHGVDVMGISRADINAIVALHANICDPSISVSVQERRIRLIQQLSALVEADIWSLVTGIINPEVTGDAMVYSCHDGGFKDAQERGDFYRIILHPDMAARIQTPLTKAVAENCPIAMRRGDLIADDEWLTQYVSEIWRSAGFDDFILVAVPQAKGYSALGVHRRLGRPRFGERELAIVEIVFTQIAWLHREINNPVAAEAALRLSPRERQVLVLLLEGASRASIASALKISVHTVVDYISEIYKEVGVNSHKQLLAHFARNS
jgi:DNA-binding CsgD family transcriptional regulator